MALLNKPKLKKGEANQQKNSMTVDQARAKILAVRNAKSGATSTYTPPATQKATAQPQTSKSVSANSRAVSSFIGGGSNYGLGTPNQRVEFSVLPGAKAGPMVVPSNAQSTQQSLLTGPNFSDKTFSALSKVSTKVGQFTGVVNEQGTGLNPTGVALNLGLAGAGGMIAKGLAKGVGAVGKGVTNLLKKGSTKVDDVARMTDDVVRQVNKAPIAGKVGRIAGPVANTVIRTVAKHPVLSGLGALAVGSALVGSGDSPTGTAGTVRNAVPSTGADTQTKEATATPTSQRTASPQSFSTFDQQVSSMSAPSGGASFVGGGSVGGGFGGGTGGSVGGSALRGEGTSEERVQAQAKAMQLARSQVDQAGVGAAPIGDQVDLASLQALRDKTRSMLDQYGPDAATMPEFKASIQALIASGVENLKKIQPSPPVPVVETPEQEQYAIENDARAFMDDVRKQLGMPDLESQRIDVMQQLQVVQETYQGVIDQIKQNPNLPKGLAARRLTEVFEDQKFASNQLLGQLEVIDQQLEDGNNELDRQFGIFTYEQDQNEKAQARRADQLGFMVDSGAIAGMSDKEIRQWASATGIPEAAIRQMKTNALNPSKEWSVSYETNPNTGEKFAIYTDKNDPTGQPQVVSLGRFGVSGGTSGTTPGAIPSTAGLSSIARAVLSGNQAIEKLSPKIRGEVTGELTAAGYNVTLPEFAAARAIIDQISAASAAVNTAQSGLGRFAAGAKNYWGGVITQTNPEAQQLSQAVGKLSTIARTLGEKGVLTDQDIERVMKLIPGLFDTAQVANNKIVDLTSLLDDIESRQQNVWVLPTAQNDEVTLDDIFGQL